MSNKNAAISKSMNDLWTVPDTPSPFTQKIIGLICSLSAPENISEEELKKGMQNIQFEFKASTPSDDDAYLTAQSPFNGKWYTFAGFMGQIDSSHPVYVDEERPQWFDKE